MRRWRGLKALVHDAVDATTELVREGNDATHRTVRRVTDQVEPIAGPARAINGLVRLSTASTLASVQLVNRVVESLTDLALDATLPDDATEVDPIPMRSDILDTAAWVADAAVATVNAAVGDHLSASGNGLDLGLQLRQGDRYLRSGEVLEGEAPIVVLVHGLGTTEWCWVLSAESYHGDPTTHFGNLLERDTGARPVFARYNTGRRIAVNGRELADALEEHLPPNAPVILLGHSMGGLVSRAACTHASRHGQHWLDRLVLVVSLGSPHQGAGLARLGETAARGLGGIDLPATRVLSRILAGRSAGIRDLEHGDLTELQRDPDATAAPSERQVPLLEGIPYAFFSATVTQDPDHPVGAWLGDLLVQVGSASGPARHETFPIQTATFAGIAHHQLQCHPDVYPPIRGLVERALS